MEIRRAYHHTSETGFNTSLKENGLAAIIEKAAENGELRISVPKNEETEAENKQLTSSFVHLDYMPGY